MKPNIVIFCTDHQRADFLSCAGHPMIKTPNLDKLAASGVRYENLYVQSTVCMPSRASIMTGTYSCRHGVNDNGYNLPIEKRTIADVLSDNGYHTMAVGRTHLVCTQPRPEYPQSGFYGFQQCSHAQVYCGNTDPDNEYLAWIRAEHPEYYDDIAFANEHCEHDMSGSHTDVPEELSLNSWVVDRSLDFIREHEDKASDQPFMLWAGTWDPHSPYRAPEPWGSMYDPEDVPLPAQIEEEFQAYPEVLKNLAVREWWRDKSVPIETVIKKNLAMYMGMVSHIDDQIGRLLDDLEEMGILDNTIFLLTSDHGDMLGEHWFEYKRLYFYDAALKVPGIMAGPGVPRGRVLSGLAESVDLMPTLLDLVGVDTPPLVQGKSWKPVLEGADTVIHDDVYTDFQYHRNPCGTSEVEEKNEHVFSIFDGRYRIVYFKNRPYGQLFDFANDPDNHINRWDDSGYAEVKRMMIEKLMNRIMDNLAVPDVRDSDW